MVFHDEVYRVARFPIGSQNNDEWWYVLMFFVKERDITTYGSDSRNKIEEFGGVLIGFFIFCGGVILAVIIMIIHCSSRSIRSPLQKIADFTNKINSHAVESEFLGNLDINSLKEIMMKFLSLLQIINR
ncbi:unnamed protein product [Blepharisma stoltei]|uniref:Uncharacterized protein n=1 Tax=Blepharisma stoltei TaxID=1481888 RepID=A0AAU9JRB4_9CILI|nr:unnamed protein product [Blepharisma stoltei]